MRPSCYNRPARPESYTANDGFDQDGRLRTKLIPWFSPDRCAAHDGVGIGPNNENYPAAHGWDCAGCHWNPNESET